MGKIWKAQTSDDQERIPREKWHFLVRTDDIYEHYSNLNIGSKSFQFVVIRTEEKAFPLWRSLFDTERDKWFHDVLFHLLGSQFANHFTKKASSCPRTHLDRSGVVDLIRKHILTAKIGPIHVTIAGFPTRSPKIERWLFSRFRKKNIRRFFVSNFISKLAKRREIQNDGRFKSPLATNWAIIRENCVLTDFTLVPGPRTLFPLAPSSLGRTKYLGLWAHNKNRQIFNQYQ